MNHKKSEVRISVEFPEQSDKHAEQEFIDRLKEIYLDALSSNPTNDTEEDAP